MVEQRDGGLTAGTAGRTIQRMMKNVVQVRDLVVVRGAREVLPGLTLDVDCSVPADAARPP
jgi:hypothetical protein